MSSRRELRKKLNTIIKIGKFSKKEKAFLQFLAKDFEPHTIQEITSCVSTKACIKLKSIVAKKIQKSGFHIQTYKGNFYQKSAYQLKFSPHI